MIEIFARKFLKKIQEYKNIALFVHIQPDFDAYASAFGIKKWINDNFPEIKTHLMIPPEIFEEKQKHLFNSEEEIPPVSVLENCLGIVVDTPSSERVLTGLHLYCKELVVIDHHLKIKGFAELEFIDPTYSATSQILAEMFFYLEEDGQYIFGDSLPQYFYAGIITDTNNFMSPSTTPSTFNVLSKLSSRGLNRGNVHDLIFTQSYNQNLFNATVLKKSVLTKNGFMYSVVTRKITERYGMQNFLGAVNILERVDNVEIWSALSYDYLSKKWKCSIRSKDLAINHVAKLYGGGGHKTMSAVVFNKRSQYNSLIVTIDEYLIKCGYRNVSQYGKLPLVPRIYRMLGWYKKT